MNSNNYSIHYGKIFIDFPGGSHGNFLEFVCNKFLADISTAGKLPFNKFGASHDKKYLQDPYFVSGHFTAHDIKLKNSKVIMICFEHTDLLPLQCISLLRAGDLQIDPADLEKNLYHKWNNQHYRWVLDNLLDKFFNINNVISGYRSIADPSWPDIVSLDDYQSLPSHIRDECETQHNFQVYSLNETSPDCPRHILREFFQIGFSHPEQNGFMILQSKKIHENCEIYRFPFSAFYDKDKFFEQISQLSIFTNFNKKINKTNLETLHEEFMARQPYKNIRQQCDLTVDQIIHNQFSSLPKIDVIQEAYISAKVKQINGEDLQWVD